jgi:hypothetical protein
MLRTALFAAAFLATAVAPASAACTGTVSITGATLQSVKPDGSLNDVNVAVTVKNAGSVKQSGNTLQSVEIFQAGLRSGTKGIPPLAPGQAYTFVYTFQRSSEAARGTTRLTFRLVGDNAAGAACVDPNRHYGLSV